MGFNSAFKGLRHCATSRKVAGSIPDGVIGIFHSLNPSGCTQPPTEMSTWDISRGGGGNRWTGLTTLPTSSADCVKSLASSGGTVPLILNLVIIWR